MNQELGCHSHVLCNHCDYAIRLTCIFECTRVCMCMCMCVCVCVRCVVPDKYARTVVLRHMYGKEIANKGSRNVL